MNFVRGFDGEGKENAESRGWMMGNCGRPVAQWGSQKARKLQEEGSQATNSEGFTTLNHNRPRIIRKADAGYGDIAGTQVARDDV